MTHLGIVLMASLDRRPYWTGFTVADLSPAHVADLSATDVSDLSATNIADLSATDVAE